LINVFKSYKEEGEGEKIKDNIINYHGSGSINNNNNNTKKDNIIN